ncbi:MAG: hypothetical protein K0R00_2487 [Herbinix sp.]|jgi:predicted DNA binding CopG/RHH family protein|nr:hypothetical protein [Herbinix sp.]
MAKNKPSTFGATDNLDFGITHNTQEVQQVHEVTQHEVQREYGSTQGNKNGSKLKRINMAFSDANHEYITKESRKNGMSATAFVNMIIDNHRNQ